MGMMLRRHVKEEILIENNSEQDDKQNEQEHEIKKPTNLEKEISRKKGRNV